MQTVSFKERIEGLALDTVWSLWAELGVSGWNRRHEDQAIDLETLLIATSELCRLDARLRDESLDWCIANARFVSAVRLRNLLADSDSRTRTAFGRLAATVRHFRRVNWPMVGERFEFEPTGRSQSPDLLRPGLVQLRLRAIFGINARPEIILRLLPEPHRPFGVAELALYTAFKKDNVADSLEMMALGGLVRRSVLTTAGDLQVFTLSDGPWIDDLVRNRPKADGYPFWPPRFRVLLRLVTFAADEGRDDLVRAADVQRFIEENAADLRWVSTFPRTRRGIQETNSDFDEWAVGLLSHWARTTDIRAG